MSSSRALVSAVIPTQLSGISYELPHSSLRRIAVLSFLTIFVGLGGVLTWANFAQISSAVPATGFVVASGKRKTITVTESGLLRELLVHEGDQVETGQTLFRLDDVQLLAARTQAKIQYWAALAKVTRLSAEAADLRELSFPDDLLGVAADEAAVAVSVAAERHQFDVRWAAFDASTRVQERKVAQTQAQIGAIRAQIAAAGTKLTLLREELRNVEYLLARGLDTKPHQLELLRTDADLRGQIGQLGSQLIQAQQGIAQIELETLNSGDTRRADISRERTETQSTLADAQQRLLAASDQLEKRVIRAPEAGVITDLKFFTVGSSINAGQPIMDLVPAGQHLLVEGTVAPNEVGHLQIGQAVNIRLTAFKAHRVPVVTGRLAYVGADRQLDANNQPVFLVRAEVDPDALADKPGVTLLPGMPAEVLILNGKRSVLSYLISPLTDSLFHAMNEE